MATAPTSTSEAILLTEKKVDMTLDDIIKMSKKSSSKARTPRASNKRRRFPISGAPQGRISPKVQRYMDSRSSLRQGLLAQKRSNFQGNQFPLAREVARKTAAAPIRNGPFSQNRVANQNKRRPAGLRNAPMNRPIEKVKMVPKQRPQTLDALFANMKEQRMRQQQPMTARGKKAGRQGTQHWQGRGGSSAGTGACL
ncbi:hypothetical protein AAC387_Pa12g1871 [Persea americana]